MGITIKDIAVMANTSTATVSRVLSRKPGVAETKRRRILSLAEKLGYRPNRLAQNLALQKSYVLGFIAADLLNPIYIDFFRRVQRRVEAMGYQVLIADSEQDAKKERHNVEVMRQHRAEGMIIFPVHDWRLHSEVDHFLELRLQKYPFVVLGKLDGLSADIVTIDEVGISYKIGRHLLELGHRSIGFVGYDTENRPVRERYEGVRKALAESGVELNPAHVIENSEGWVDRTVAMLRRPDRPTALVIISDVNTLMALRLIQETGLRIPEDLSIATFENGIWTRHLKPTITTTGEVNSEIATLAMDLLFARMEDRDRPPRQHLLLPELLIRESTGPCPKR